MPHPPLGSRPQHPEPLGFLADRETGIIDRGRADHHARDYHQLLLGTRLQHELTHRESQRSKSFSRRCRYLENPVAAGFQIWTDEVGEFASIGDVDLVQRHKTWALGQPSVRLKFGLDHIEIAERIASGLHRGAIDHVHQHAAPLDVPQELKPQTLALAGTGDQTGNISNGEHDVVRRHHSKVRNQGGEWIVRDLRARR